MGQQHRFGATAAPPLLSTAADQRRQLQARRQHQGPDAPGPLQLVGGAAEQIDRQLGQVDGLMADHLDRIDMQPHAGGAAERPELGEGLEAAHLALAPDQ